MEKKKYIVLLLQIAAVAAAGVIGGDTLFALVTALIGITFNFMVSMNFAAGSDGSLQLLEMEREEETDGNHYAEDEPQGAELYGSWSDDTV